LSQTQSKKEHPVPDRTALDQHAPETADIPPLAEDGILSQIGLPARGGQLPVRRFEGSPAQLTRSGELSGCECDIQPIVDEAILREVLWVGLK
jgi:hypothetical protein